VANPTEVRCGNCGTLNRVRAYSFRKIPNCGNCHKPLNEPSATKTLRSLYRWRWYFAALAILASPLMFFVWPISSPYSATTASPNSCTARTQPREGVFKWYGRAWGDDIAELTIRTAFGSNYFIKLEDMSGRPARAYFMQGGSTQTFPVPLGTFALKYATGSSWCSESEFFGASTGYNEVDRTLTFKQQVRADADGTTTLTSDVTVELVRQRGGNLPTHAIPREKF
jgi:hypothetical protein